MFKSKVILVRACSERFLSDLESRWQESVRLTGIADILRAHAKENFQVYVKYCSNQVYQDRTLKRLKLENPKFVEALKELESSSACQSLAMHSFLMLPMQRITRLPLLTDAIHQRLPKESPEQPACAEAMNLLNNLVQVNILAPSDFNQYFLFTSTFNFTLTPFRFTFDVILLLVLLVVTGVQRLRSDNGEDGRAAHPQPTARLQVKNIILVVNI